nr:hypothetical protein BACY1_15050 [Tenacibaculum mesophilum]
MKNVIIKSLYLLTITITLSSCCATRMDSCPDGRPVSFPKSERCAAKIYQDAVKDFKVSLKATVNVIDQVSVGVDNLEIKNESKLLKDKLNQESIRLQETYKASYLAITRDPCANSERHYKLVESVSKKNYELQELKTKLENETKQKEIKSTLNNYLYQRGKKEGTAIGKIAGTLDRYFVENNKYPKSLENIGVKDEVNLLGISRLEYVLISSSEYSMRFAGEDYVLGSADDKLYKGKDGKTELQE